MTELAAAVRFVHLAAAVFLAGNFAFVYWIARPAFVGAVGSAAEQVCLARHRRAAFWSLGAIFASAVAALWLQAIVVSAPGAGGVDTGSDGAGLAALIDLLTQTQYGRAWMFRFGIAVLLAMVVLHGGQSSSDSRLSFLSGLVLSVSLLGSSALSGHSASGEGWEFALQVCADVLHLLAAGAWLGGLVPLFLLLRYCTRSSDIHSHSLVQAVTRRYSRMGIACVAVLMLTGGLNAWALVGGVPQLLGTPYGRLLLLKLALLLPLLGVAALNLWKLNPAIAAAPLPPSGAWQSHSRKLARNAMIEAGLGIVILLIVAMLGTTPPARHVQPDWPLAFRWDWSMLERLPEARIDVETGLAWLVLGLFVLQFAFLSRHLRVWTIAVGSALVIYAGSAVFNTVIKDAYPTSFRRPEVAYQALSLANGKQLYDKSCIECHGEEGRGDGPGAHALRPRSADLTGSHTQAQTAGELYWSLSHGISHAAMQDYGASLAEEERWDLINYVRALFAARTALKLAPVIDAEARLVAPDFVYWSANGEIRALKDHRGNRLVLLVLLDGEGSAARLAQLGEAAARLKDAGVEILAVPRDPRSVPAAPSSALALVNEGNREIHAAFALFAGTASGESGSATKAPVEYLIDRQGYIRARWLSAASDAWRDPEAIITQAERLRKESPRTPVPEEHVH